MLDRKQTEVKINQLLSHLRAEIEKEKASTLFLSNQIEYWKNKASAYQQLAIFEKHRLNSQLSDFDFVLSSFFSSGQIQAIHLGAEWKNKIRWSPEDISNAISLQSVSPKAYRYLSIKCNFPLPSVSTLCRWAQKMTFKSGFIEEVFAVMKGLSENMS